MTANKILLQRKYARVIETFSKRQNLPIRTALDIFYGSRLYHEMRDGISDMHCRSDEYLAEELFRDTTHKP
ncbi:MAG: DUF3791 domain-containing protein [Candidatus Accumulibacter sp.]|jgi:hypothetical protein|nr:DUF3791 domain-containing protein [Accumulibacter sp.]